MKKNQTNNTLAVADTSLFDKMEVVKQKLNKLQVLTDSPYQTPGRVTLQNGTVCDIKTETNVNNIVMAYARVTSTIKFYDDAYDELGIITRKVTKVDGGTKEEWKKDATLRINIINNQSAIDKLNKIEAGLRDLMGKEEKAALLMADLDNI